MLIMLKINIVPGYNFYFSCPKPMIKIMINNYIVIDIIEL